MTCTGEYLFIYSNITSFFFINNEVTFIYKPFIFILERHHLILHCRFVLFKRHYDKYVALAEKYEESRGVVYYLEERYHEVKVRK